MTQASDFKYKIVVQNQIITNDGFGGVDVQWKNCATLYASVDPIDTIQKKSSNGNENLTIYRITTRFLDSVNVNQRILFGDKILTIRGVMSPMNNGKTIVIMAEYKVKI